MSSGPGAEPMTGAGPPRSVIAAIPAGYKFAFLFVAGIVTYLISGLVAQSALFALAILVVLLTRVSVLRLLKMMSGLLVIVGFVFVTTALTASWTAAVAGILRLLTLCLFAYAVTLSTRFSEMLTLFEAFLRPLRHLGLNSARMSLALSMTVRFIPEIRTRYLEVREAQYARGLQNSPVAVMVPLIVRTLESAREISAAIDARCYDTGPPQRQPAARSSAR